jgi:hypothetical protein
VITIQREQYRGIVHLFIGTRHSPDKTTYVSLTTNYNYNIDYQGLYSLFLFKSVSSFVFSMSPCRSSFNRSFDLYLHVTPAYVLGEYPCIATGTYNNIITYIQNVSYIVIKNIS